MSFMLNRTYHEIRCRRMDYNLHTKKPDVIYHLQRKLYHPKIMGKLSTLYRLLSIHCKKTKGEKYPRVLHGEGLYKMGPMSYKVKVIAEILKGHTDQLPDIVIHTLG